MQCGRCRHVRAIYYIVVLCLLANVSLICHLADSGLSKCEALKKVFMVEVHASRKVTGKLQSFQVVARSQGLKLRMSQRCLDSRNGAETWALRHLWISRRIHTRRQLKPPQCVQLRSQLEDSLLCKSFQDESAALQSSRDRCCERECRCAWKKRRV